MIGKTNVKVKPNKRVIIDYVEYIESTGTQYIDTGVIPNQDTSIEIKFENTKDNTWLFGTRTSNSSSDMFALYLSSLSGGSMWFMYGTAGNLYTTNINMTGVHTIKTNKEKLYIDDNLKITREVATFTSPKSLKLLTCDTNGTINSANFVGKIHYYKIYDGDILVRDFRTAKDNTGVYCLYDEVEKRYYYNQGTGEFLGGASI